MRESSAASVYHLLIRGWSGGSRQLPDAHKHFWGRLWLLLAVPIFIVTWIAVLGLTQRHWPSHYLEVAAYGPSITTFIVAHWWLHRRSELPYPLLTASLFFCIPLANTLAFRVWMHIVSSGSKDAELIRADLLLLATVFGLTYNQLGRLRRQQLWREIPKAIQAAIGLIALGTLLSTLSSDDIGVASQNAFLFLGSLVATYVLTTLIGRNPANLVPLILLMGVSTLTLYCMSLWWISSQLDFIPLLADDFLEIKKNTSLMLAFGAASTLGNPVHITSYVCLTSCLFGGIMTSRYVSLLARAFSFVVVLAGTYIAFLAYSRTAVVATIMGILLTVLARWWQRGRPPLVLMLLLGLIIAVHGPSEKTRAYYGSMAEAMGEFRNGAVELVKGSSSWHDRLGADQFHNPSISDDLESKPSNSSWTALSTRSRGFYMSPNLVGYFGTHRPEFVCPLRWEPDLEVSLISLKD
jgi:hypothetical protein